MLNIAKSNHEIVEKTHFKPQETLEFKMTEQKESFSFEVPLELNEKWMMGVTRLEVYNTVYKITIDNKLQIMPTEEQTKECRIATELAPKNASFYDIFVTKFKTEDDEEYNEFVEKTNTFISNSKKLTGKDFNHLQILIEDFNQRQGDQQMTIAAFDIEMDFIEMELPPGVYALDEINNAIKQKIIESGYELVNTRQSINPVLLSSSIEFNIEAVTILLKSILTTSNLIRFNTEMNKFLGFTSTIYDEGTHKSEKSVMITSIDKVHLKCDCVDGSIVNGVREKILYSFNPSSPSGYKVLKSPITLLYKKINKSRLDNIQLFLEDCNHNPVDFNNGTLTFTIQIIKN